MQREGEDWRGESGGRSERERKDERGIREHQPVMTTS
jgi:hypothetical protein